MKTLLCLASALMAALTVAAQGSVEAMLNYAPTNTGAYSMIGSSVNRSFGWTFEPLANIDVTALGALNYIMPTSGGIQVGLWNANGVLLASETITASSTSNNQSFYQSTTPVLLVANQTYYLAAYSAAGYQFYVAGPDVDQPNAYATMSPEIQLGGIAYTPNAGFAFPSTTEGSAGDGVLAPNFQFQVVPESSIFCLFGGGAVVWLAWQHRRKFVTQTGQRNVYPFDHP